MTAEFKITDNSYLHIRYIYAKSCGNYKFDVPVKIKITAYRLDALDYIEPVIRALKDIAYIKYKGFEAENRNEGTPRVEVWIGEDI